MLRRKFLQDGSMVALHCGASMALPAARPRAAKPPPGRQPEFRTANVRWQAAYDKALAILAANVQVLPRFARPVLIEGAQYAGIWQECGPMEALSYRHMRPDVARNSHDVFFALQRADGQLPANNKRSETGFGQIQMVVPIAATAWELAEGTGDDELLARAYTSCSRWDAWLRRYRNTRGTGLVEGFCTYDTGMDNSPRWAGVPPQCPAKDATRFPAGFALPRLCPDLSATVYGGRVALAAMATALGKHSEAARWQQDAEELRRLLLDRLFVREDAAFFDLDANDAFVKIQCDTLTRVCGEHVVDQRTFDDLWSRALGKPAAFWTPYPLPSVAADDPRFVTPPQHNSWGGPSQALTALRAGRWLDFYHRSAALRRMMDAWCEAIQRDMTFRQQIDPATGVFTEGDLPAYSPCALVMYEFTWRLCGVREAHGQLEWNVSPSHPAAQAASFTLPLKTRTAQLKYRAGGAELRLGSRQVATMRGTARLTTSADGHPQALTGIAPEPQIVELRLPHVPVRRYTVNPDQRISLT